MSKLPFICIVPPDRLHEVRQIKGAIAHMAYRIGHGPHLFRGGTQTPPRGGYMVIDCQGFDGKGESSGFCQEVYRECTARGFRGVICDFDHPRLALLERIVRSLEEGLAKRNLTLIVPEAYGALCTNSKVMISSAISGGSFAVRLEEAVAHFGPQRLLLSVEPIAEDFFLPSSTKTGTPLSTALLHEKLEQLSPAVFFSTELCARYFTHMSRETGAHFILFDDVGTLEKKLSLAHALGITGAIAAWPEVSEWVKELEL